MWNWLRILYWKVIYFRMIDSAKEIKKCDYCGKVYLTDLDSIRYKHWNISGYYEEYFLCTTGKKSCYANFLDDYVLSSNSNDIDIYVVNA